MHCWCLIYCIMLSNVVKCQTHTLFTFNVIYLKIMIMLGMLIAFFYPKIKFSLNKDVIPDNVITKYCAKLLFFIIRRIFKKICLITRLTLSSHRVSLSIGWNYKQSCPPGYYRRLCRSLCEGDVSECHHLIGCTTTKVSF